LEEITLTALDLPEAFVSLFLCVDDFAGILPEDFLLEFAMPKTITDLPPIDLHLRHSPCQFVPHLPAMLAAKLPLAVLLCKS
jgi:hypothetical protein